MKRLQRGVVLAVLALTLVVSVATAQPAAAAVTVTVDPATGLADGQPVTVSGSGFAPQATVGAAECSAAVSASRNTSDCDLSTSRTMSADGAGAATMVLRMKRTISTSNGTIDCATAVSPCVVGMADTSDFQTSSGMAITFDPNAPPLPPPSVSLTPDSSLVDRQQVAVLAKGFIPGESVLVSECAATAIDNCFPGPFGGGFGQADPTGAVAIGITVRRPLLVDGQRLDCASKSGACVITAAASGGPVGSAPLDFDASVPLPPPPTITVTPAGGLADRQIVAVTGSGFTANFSVVLTECKAGTSPDQGGCSNSAFRETSTDAQGSFSTNFQVRRTLQVFEPDKPAPTDVDCAAAAGTCAVNAFDPSDPIAAAATPVSFDPNAPPLPPGTATATPSAALVDGQDISIAGDGFAPGEPLIIVQCIAGATDSSGCDISNLQSGTADDNGHLDAHFQVKRILNLFGPPVAAPPVLPGQRVATPAATAFFAGDVPPDAPQPSTFDCASAPGACTVSVAFLGSTIEAVGIPLSFDPTVPPTSGSAPPPATPSAPAGSDAEGASTSADRSGTSTPRPALARTGPAHLAPLLDVDVALLILGSVALLASFRLRRR